tara:strand:+ start:628 stop:936 length:309 start_codon:yes stop_codon:yes gene_type:complete
VLHDAVLARVVRQDDSPTGWGQPSDRLVQGVAQLVQFGVYFDADGLEGAFRWVSTTATCRGGNGVTNNFGKMGCIGHRAGGHHCAGNAPGMALVGMVDEQAG